MSQDTKDRLRWWMTWAIFGAGVVVTLFALFYSLIVWLGPWSLALEAARLELLGQALIIAWVSIIIVVVVFGLGGPLGRLKGSVGPVSVEAEKNDDSD